MRQLADLGEEFEEASTVGIVPEARAALVAAGGEVVENTESPYFSVVGGLVYPGITLVTRGGFSWPFAGLSLFEDRIELRPRRIFARLGQVVVIPYDQLDHVEISAPPVFGQLGGTIFFRSAGADFDRASFSAWRPTFRKILRGLSAMGVRRELARPGNRTASTSELDRTCAGPACRWPGTNRVCVVPASAGSHVSVDLQGT